MREAALAQLLGDTYDALTVMGPQTAIEVLRDHEAEAMALLHQPEAAMPTLAQELETLIDRHGLKALLDGLSEICHEKADHVRTNWQDERLGRMWERAAGDCDRAASRTALDIAQVEGRR